MDPNPYFGPYLEQLRHKHPGIKFGDLIVAGAEDMSQIKDNLFDACVLSVVLCSAGDPTQCLQEMKRVLKPVSNYSLSVDGGWSKISFEKVSFSVSSQAILQRFS